MLGAMPDVTRILSAAAAGDPRAAAELLPLVYEELRKLAAARLAEEKPGQTLQATALVHEAYLRLVGNDQPWNGRGHFFAAAAEAMRRILINRAGTRAGSNAAANDGARSWLTSPTPRPRRRTCSSTSMRRSTRLDAVDPRCAELVKLRFYAGLTQGEAAEALGVSRSAADRDWAFARAWLYRALSAD